MERISAEASDRVLGERRLTYLGTIRGPFRTTVDVVTGDGDDARTLEGKRTIARRHFAEHPADRGKTLDLYGWRYAPEIERRLAKQRRLEQETTKALNEGAIASIEHHRVESMESRNPADRHVRGTAPTFAISLAYWPATPLKPRKDYPGGSRGRTCFRQARAS